MSYPRLYGGQISFDVPISIVSFLDEYGEVTLVEGLPETPFDPHVDY